jgi:hypothetical protein
MDSFGKSRGNAFFRTIYPSTYYTENHEPIRSLILVNTNISTDCYSSLNIPSSDITAIHLRTSSGSIALFNIYNDNTHNRSITAVDSFLSRHPILTSASHNNHMAWFGNFNRHHPLWEELRNAHLFNNPRLTDPLLDLIHSYGMCMMLPPGIPTLEASSTGNWTRPDNVWCSGHNPDIFICCDIAPALRPPLADHLPIISTLRIPPKRAISLPTHNFWETDWAPFRSHLSRLLEPHPPSPLISLEQTATTISTLTKSLQENIAAIVPLSNPSPFTKHWWTKELSQMRKEKNRLSAIAFKFRYVPDHPSKKAYRSFANKYVKEIRKVKKEHWEDWLQNISDKDIFVANRIATDLPSDYARALSSPL